MFSAHFTFDSFRAHFNSDQTCADALFAARWPDGFRCPACLHTHFYLIRTRRLLLYECTACRRQTSVITGTIMQGSRTPLTRWFQAMFLLSQPAGISAIRLSEMIRVTYKTAWLIAHKIRHAMQQSGKDQLLTGFVRMDRVYYGAPQFFGAEQPLLIGGSFDEYGEPQQIKIAQPDPSHVQNDRRRIEKPGVDAFVRDHVEKGVVPLSQRGLHHPPLSLISRSVNRWLNDTFQGIGAKHLQAYLDEFCFRLNLDFRRMPVVGEVVHWCAITPTLIYKDLIRNKPVLPVPRLIWGSKAKWKGKLLSLWQS